MVNNSVNLQKHKPDFPVIFTEENENKWAASPHKEEETEELRDLLVKQK